MFALLSIDDTQDQVQDQGVSQVEEYPSPSHFSSTLTQGQKTGGFGQPKKKKLNQKQRRAKQLADLESERDRQDIADKKAVQLKNDEKQRKDQLKAISQDERDEYYQKKQTAFIQQQVYFACKENPILMDALMTNIGTSWKPLYALKHPDNWISIWDDDKEKGIPHFSIEDRGQWPLDFVMERMSTSGKLSSLTK
jgi:hypothetical protein